MKENTYKTTKRNFDSIEVTPNMSGNNNKLVSIMRYEISEYKE